LSGQGLTVALFRPDAITTEIMTEVLRHEGWLGSAGRVTGLRVGQVGGFGLFGQVDRLWLDYSGDVGAAPRSVIIKHASPERADSSALALAEARFYRERVLESAGVHAPRVYHCTIDEETGTCLLLLEDLGDAGFVRQLHGCAPDRAAVALAEVSRLHGHWWNREPPASLDWIRAPVDAEISAFCGRWLRAYNGACTGDWPTVLGQIPSLLVRNLDALAERLSRSPRTLVHGDFHCQNMAFRGTQAVTFIDFQFVQRATAMFDVARFLATSLTTGTRRAVETDLLEHYHDQLAEHGVAGYGPVEAADELRAALLWNLATPLALHAREMLTQSAHWRGELPILERCVRAIEDWDAFSIL
jgi:phosphotransferase family enzyme